MIENLVPLSAKETPQIPGGGDSTDMFLRSSSNVRIVLEGGKTWELYGNAKNAYTMLNFFNSFNSLFFILILKTEVRIHFVKRNEADALADLNFNSYSKIARLLSSSQKQANEMHIWTRQSDKVAKSSNWKLMA